MKTPKGSKQKHSTQIPDDRDIESLFKAQDIVPPAELDESILAAARQSVSVDGQPLESGQPPVSKRQAVALKPTRFATIQQRNRWLSVAATVVVAVALAPLLLNSPESEISHTVVESARTLSVEKDSALSQTAQTKPAPSITDQAITTDSSDLESDLIEEASTLSIQRQAVQIPSGPASNAALLAESMQQNSAVRPEQRKPQITAARQQSFAAAEREATPHEGKTKLEILTLPTLEGDNVKLESIASSGGNAGDALHQKAARASDEDTNVIFSESDQTKLETVREDKIPQHQRAPDSWLREIRRLFKDGKLELARKEYKLFRQQFPHFEPGFSLELKKP